MGAPTAPGLLSQGVTSGPPAAVGTSVIFVTDRRPEAATIVRLEGFDGPLGLLLSLIEAQQLDILTVRLGDLAGAYLEALARLPGERLVHLSTFVAVAAQLILIKSRALLPAPPSAVLADDQETPDPEAELRRRLILYRLYRDAGTRLGELLASGRSLAHREASVAAAAGLANARPAPGPALDPGLLAAALRAAAQLTPEPGPPPEIVARTITLAERAAAIREALSGGSVIVLQELLAGARDRVLVAVTFLALLELVKRREVVAEQDEPWGPIRCRRSSATERAAAGGAGATATVAEAPIDESLEGLA